jgi:hypothetical protein
LKGLKKINPENNNRLKPNMFNPSIAASGGTINLT